jgi:hypothetical protein
MPRRRHPVVPWVETLVAEGGRRKHRSLTVGAVGLADWQVMVVAQLQLLASIGGQVHIDGRGVGLLVAENEDGPACQAGMV